ncbi:MAG: hypothetical protein QNK03_20675 [Myxococcota bacterium]|nr:hypothetical protein [Myxococcota bacterium]
MRIAVFAAAILVLSGGAVRAQVELVTNGTFDESLDGWSFFVGAASSVDWDAADADGDGSSGSIRIEIDPAAPGNTLSPNQCFAVLGGASYDLSASVYQPSSSPLASAFLRLQWYTEPNCGGDNLGSSDGPDSGTQDAWVSLFRAAESPLAARSGRLFLTTFEDPDRTTHRVASWDDVSVAPEPGAATSTLAAGLALGLLRARNRRSAPPPQPPERRQARRR